MSTNYAKNDADTLDVKEPAVAYYTGGVGNAVADPDDDWDDDENFGAPESITVRTYEELFQKLEEGRIAEIEGRVRPIDEFWHDFKRKIENGEL